MKLGVSLTENVEDAGNRTHALDPSIVRGEWRAPEIKCSTVRFDEPESIYLVGFIALPTGLQSHVTYVGRLIALCTTGLVTRLYRPVGSAV